MAIDVLLLLSSHHIGNMSLHIPSLLLHCYTVTLASPVSNDNIILFMTAGGKRRPFCSTSIVAESILSFSACASVGTHAIMGRGYHIAAMLPAS